MSGTRIHPLQVAGARHRGERHAAAGQPCSDALLLVDRRQDTPSGFVICDGAGSGAMVAHSAHLGSRAAWRALLAVRRELKRARRLRQELPTRWQLQRRFHAVFWHDRGASNGCDHTLLACLWDQQQLLVAQVGDSVLLLKRQGQWHLPLPPGKGLYANETVFMRPQTAPAAIGLWWCDLHQVEALIGWSDGMEAAFLAPNPANPEHWTPNQPLAELVLQQQVRRLGWRGYAGWLQQSLADPGLQALSDDDRTLVIASR